MQGFWNFMIASVAVLGAVVITFLILLSLPNSRLRSYLMEAFGWGAAAASAVYVASPIDLIPDFIPGLGQLDDVGALIAGLAALFLALYQHRQRSKWHSVDALARRG